MKRGVKRSSVVHYLGTMASKEDSLFWTNSGYPVSRQRALLLLLLSVKASLAASLAKL
jgi:hypothetical protein